MNNTTDQETTLCPYCGTTQPTLKVYDHFVIVRHMDGNKACRGWGLSVTLADELTAAVTELLRIIGEKLEKPS